MLPSAERLAQAPPVCVEPSSQDFQFRALSKGLTDEGFRTKWNAVTQRSCSVKDFMRAFPQVYHHDAATHFFGAESIQGWEDCVVFGFGDLHPDNFGWQLVGSRHTDAVTERYVFNDLDDVGFVLAPVDFLRYVALVRAQYGGTLTPSALQALVSVYATTVLSAVRATPAPSVADPPRRRTWPKRWKKAVADHVAPGGRRFSFAAADLSAVDEGTAKAVSEFLGDLRSLRVTRVWDVAFRKRDTGGSGGLLRYWALVSRLPFEGESQPSAAAPEDLTVLELKELTAAATELIPTPLPHREGLHLSDAARVALAKQLFWGTPLPHDAVVGSAVLGAQTVGAPFFRRTFMVRDRARRQDHEDPEDRTAQLELLLMRQVQIAAAHHRGAYPAALTPAALSDWLLTSSELILARWSDALRRAATTASSL